MKFDFKNTGNYFYGKEKEIRFFLIVFFIVGILGVALPLSRNLFITLIPLALLLSIIVLIPFHQSETRRKEVLVFLSIPLVSFLIEAVGVNYDFVFGIYDYGNGLGTKILNTPLLIGVNWLLLVYCTAVIFEKIPISSIWKITGAALLMVLYDYVMEQVAPWMDMWSFEGGFAPLKNYISWFILALFFHSIIRITGIRITNRIAPFVFYCQLVFFIILFIIFIIAE
ncbi:MAG: carotenoid biosynthesis protein [Bacteroidales bacterium]|jgi:putative membrane protein|nr:carotenoid biosynthesis protein [Bacteroidales bacterium]